jgi:protein TonB
MKTGTLLVAATAMAASLGLHFAGFISMPEASVQIQGGAQTEMARLGNSFADMSQSVLAPPPPEELLKTVPVETAQKPEPVTERKASPPPVPDNRTMPVPGNRTMPVVVATNTINPVVAEIDKQVSALNLTPAPTTALAVIKPAEPLETIKARTPIKVEKARPDTRPPVARPQVRTEKRTEKPAKPRATKRKPAKARTKPAASAQAARRGQVDGSVTARATQSVQTGKRQAAAGNAAAANYRGKVMRKIQRTRKESARANGKTVVSFRVSDSGAATSVRVLRSSGSAKIDSIALRHIKRSSPFPKPPKGASRSFKITIVARR